MRVRSILLTAAVAASLHAGGNHNYDFTNEYFISKSPNLFNVVTPPAGLDTSKVPLFITLGFDDNKYADGVDWVRDTLLAGRLNHSGQGNKATYDGTPMKADFNVIGNSDYTWSASPYEAPLPEKRPVTASWRRAYDNGLGVNNHTWTHDPNLSDLELETWKGDLPPLMVELGMCSKYLVNIMGMPHEHIYGFRTPYLAHSISNNWSFQALANIGVLYDCTLDNGMQGNQPATWANPGWPGMMNDGWGPYTGVATKGLWQIPNSIFQTVEGGTFSDKGFDSGPKGWPGGASSLDMFKQMRSAIIWSYNKNRAPVDLGLHSDYYSNTAQNKTGTAANGFSTSLKDRQDALVMLLDWIQDSLPDARVVNKIDIIRWMRNPVELQDNSRNTELTFSTSDIKTSLSTGSAVYASNGSSVSIEGNKASVIVADDNTNWLPDAWAGMKWNIDGSIAGTHSVRISYTSDIPLRLMLIQDNMTNKEAGYYGIGLPTTLGENRTVELPLITDYFEPPRPYVATTTLDLSQVSGVALVGQVFDTTMSGTFTAEIELFGGDVSTVAVSPKARKAGVQFKNFNSNNALVSVPANGNYTVELFSLNGKKLHSSTTSFAEGENRVQWNNSLAKGIYLAKITGNGQTISLRQAISH